MPRIREQERENILNAIAGGVTPRQGIQHIQVGRKEETEALLDDIKRVESGSGAIRILQANYGSGKALPLDTKVLTPTAWVPIRDLSKGDIVYDRNGQRTKITGIYDNESEQAYEIGFDDGTSIECSGNHQWIVIDDSGTEHTMTTAALEEKLAGGKRSCYSIPTCPAPDHDSHKPLLVYPSVLGKFLIENDSPTAYIHESYLLSSRENRNLLFTSMVLSISEANPKAVNLTENRITHKTQSRQLAYDMATLARSLGMVSRISSDCNAHTVTISTSSASKRNIESVRNLHRAEPMRCLSVSSPTESYIIQDYIVTHNTFMLTLAKSVALKKNFVVMTADFSPDRRLYSSSGKAKNLYQELIRSMSTMMTPDGGALPELLNALDDKTTLTDAEFLANIRKLPYGYDAITALAKWHQSRVQEEDQFIIQDACLRWFSGENTVEHKKLLGVKETINDSGTYDALKLIAILAKYAGYAGLIVELDECVNLFKINDSTSRDRNYEQILRIFNETRQGDAKHIGFFLGGTPEFVMDPRRGLFSYDALRSRLIASEYADTTTTDKDAPIIDLKPLPQESLLVLLKNIINVQALGNEDNYIMSDDDITLFLRKCFETLGAEYYRTPREILRDFIAIIRRLEQNPNMTPQEAIGATQITTPQSQQGNTIKTTLMQKQANTKPEPQRQDTEDDFGF